MIYFIVQQDKYVKIGRSVNPEERKKLFQTGNPNRLKIWVIFPGGEETERRVHEFWRNWRYRGEWFRFDEEMKLFLGFWAKHGSLDKAIEVSLRHDEQRRETEPEETPSGNEPDFDDDYFMHLVK